MTRTTPTVHAVVPASVHDSTRPSGGNVYDRRLCVELGLLGWAVQEHALPGQWPDPGPADVERLSSVLDQVPPDDVVLVDGLVASAAAAEVGRSAERLRVVVLVHLPLGVASPPLRDAEGALLRRAAAVVTTSAWTRTWLAENEGVPEERIRVAVPGADTAGRAPGTRSGDALLTVGAITPLKGHDLLVDALLMLRDLEWRWRIIGSVDVDPGFASTISARAAELGDHISLTGPAGAAELDAAYRDADVLVLPSRAESYGMVVTEALAHGLPVIAAAVGGVAEALGADRRMEVPGLLVPPDDPVALAAALRSWLGDPALRSRARSAARDRRRSLPSWVDTATRVAEVLEAAHVRG